MTPLMGLLCVYGIPTLLCFWYMFGCPFPFINIGCWVNNHRFKYHDSQGMGEVVWFGHFDANGKRKFKYVGGYTVRCKKCGLQENRLIPNTEDMKFAKNFMGENAFYAPGSPFRFK